MDPVVNVFADPWLDLRFAEKVAVAIKVVLSLVVTLSLIGIIATLAIIDSHNGPWDALLIVALEMLTASVIVVVLVGLLAILRLVRWPAETLVAESDLARIARHTTSSGPTPASDHVGPVLNWVTCPSCRALNQRHVGHVECWRCHQAFELEGSEPSANEAGS